MIDEKSEINMCLKKSLVKKIQAGATNEDDRTEAIHEAMQDWADIQNKEFRDICEEFIERVQNGTVRSKHTWNRMVHALKGLTTMRKNFKNSFTPMSRGFKKWLEDNNMIHFYEAALDVSEDYSGDRTVRMKAETTVQDIRDKFDRDHG